MSLGQAFDTEAIDNLLFLDNPDIVNLKVSGDGVLKFSRLIGAGLADFALFMQNGPILLYDVRLSEKGRMMVDAWKSGDRQAVADAMVHARTTT